LQADTQTTVTMLCLADLHVLNKKAVKQNIKKRNVKKREKRDKKVKKRKKNVFTSMRYNTYTGLHVVGNVGLTGLAQEYAWLLSDETL